MKSFDSRTLTPSEHPFGDPSYIDHQKQELNRINEHLTVQKLIDLLNEIEDKSMRIYAVDDVSLRAITDVEIAETSDISAFILLS